MADASMPFWLIALSVASLLVAIGCASWITADVVRHPQQMKVMDAVWPLTALFGSVLWLRLYLRHGRVRAAGTEAGDANHDDSRSAWIPVAIGTSHCGAGCALGDLVAEFAVAAVPALAVFAPAFPDPLGHTLSAWLWDLVAAYILGIGFQYFAIAPRRDQPKRRSLLDAVKADTASIVAWQLGMYGAMAVIQFGLVRPWLGAVLSPVSPVFWFGMQFAMLAGFVVSFPVNALLIRRGIKERM